MKKLRLGGTLDDYCRMVGRGDAQVHQFSGGFAITEVKQYNSPDERVLNVLILGGKNFDTWRVEADETLMNFARENGCSAIEFAARLGLAKKIADLGYRRQRVLMRKELECVNENSEQTTTAIAA